VKLNVDASFDESRGCGSVGTIIRNSMGAASHRYVPHLVDAPMAEAYALKEGLILRNLLDAIGLSSNRIAWRLSKR
jgi:hypothetical protein